MNREETSCFASIIVPVYNAERWLQECIESVLAQSDNDYELVLIDDGSQDQSACICDAYLKAHPQQIRVVHQTNQGVSKARNVGIDMAGGEFLLFADADDLLHPQMIEMLKAAHEMANADCYYWSYQSFSENVRFPAVHSPSLQKSCIDELLHKVLAPDGDVLGFVWNKAFRKAAVQGIRFDEDIRLQEDLLYVCRCLTGTGIQSCCRLELPLYGYRQHSLSASHRSFSLNQLTILLARERMIQALEGGSPAAAEESIRLSADLPRHICILHKKLLHTPVENRDEAFRLIDRCWRVYSANVDLSLWSFKEKSYYFLQKICYYFRAGRADRQK